MTDRIRLVVLFGGRSAEHEVSCVSALHVLRAADPTRYHVVPVGITRDGRWLESAEAAAALETAASALPDPDASTGTEVDPLPMVAQQAGGDEVVVLPLLHGPMGEDGTVQGLLELAGVPYVGAGVLGSAVSMDKSVAKEILTGRGLPIARWIGLRETDVDDDLGDRVGDELAWPVFVKPANLGSSVGVTKVGGPGALPTAVNEALRYDEYILIEESITGREIEVAVLGNADPRASLPGEVVPSHEFYDYEDKYLDGGAELVVPARLSPELTTAAQRLAVEAFTALRVDGMARVDFFLDDGPRGLLINEVNTIPGFTPISMYPKLWEASGVPYAKLIDELVQLALERHHRRQGFDTDWHRQQAGSS
ncbi:MAG: D-alanine--D-alanine ligase family protein [Acidimicrobiales bacterium]